MMIGVKKTLVIKRFTNIIDAVASDTMYHGDCTVSFRRPKKEVSDAKVYHEAAMDDVHEFLKKF